jgi:hypothetical protein
MRGGFRPSAVREWRAVTRPQSVGWLGCLRWAPRRAVKRFPSAGSGVCAAAWKGGRRSSRLLRMAPDNRCDTVCWGQEDSQTSARASSAAHSRPGRRSASVEACPRPGCPSADSEEQRLVPHFCRACDICRPHGQGRHSARESRNPGHTEVSARLPCVASGSRYSRPGTTGSQTGGKQSARMRPTKGILVSWRGRTDPRAVTDSGQVGIGPIAQALRAGGFSRLELLCDGPADEAGAHMDWLRPQADRPIPRSSRTWLRCRAQRTSTPSTATRGRSPPRQWRTPTVKRGG